MFSSTSSQPTSTSRLPHFDALTWSIIWTITTLFGLILGLILERSSLESWAWLGFGLAFLSGGIPAARSALHSLLKERKLDVDLLMVLAAVGAASIGQATDGAILLFLFSLSNTLQDWAMGRTKRAIEALMALNPSQATVRRDGQERIVTLDELALGDVLIIRPGERIPADARIVKGSSALDESPITGESRPIDKTVGDGLSSGTVNLQGVLEAEVLRAAGESTLARLIRMVEQAQADKSPFESLAERWESPYASGVLILVPIVFVVLHYVFNLSVADAWYRAMTFMVVASPCAVIISTPAVMLSAMAAAARAGVLFKNSAALEQLSHIQSMAFDKTGTLTEGKMRLIDFEVFVGEEQNQLAWLAALERHSEHPVAKAVVLAADNHTLPAVHEVSAVAGKGIIGQDEAGQNIWAGNRAMASHVGATVPQNIEERLRLLEGKGITTLLFGREGTVAAIAGIADTLRPESAAILQQLQQLGIHTVMLTGDHPTVAQEIGQQLGIREVHAGLLPEDKLHKLKTLQAPVALVGDGVNDAPALTAADLGIGMATGSDIAIESADVVLMKGDLSGLAGAVRLARDAERTVRFNLIFAFSVIVVVGILSLFGKVPLPLGVIAHEGGTVFVVFMGLRLLGFQVRPNKKQANSS